MKKRILAMLLSLAMTVTAFPATVFAAERDAVEDTTAKIGINIAPEAEASAERSNQYVSVTNVNDGNTTNSWNTWGIEGEHPADITLTWDTARKVNSMQVIWWADLPDPDASTGVTFPTKEATAQYLAEDGETWVNLGNVGTDVNTSSNNGLNGNNQHWNELTFDEVETKAVRLLVYRSGSGKNGVGIAEWEVYGTPYDAGEGSNVALKAKASADSENEPVSRINDGILAESYNTSWNTWSAGEDYPLSAVLTWDEPQSLMSARIMWWADNPTVDVDNNVTFPKSAILEYYDHAAEKWIQIKGMTNEFGEITDNLGVLWGKDDDPQPISNSASGYINGGNRYWNEVTFAEEVKTTMLRVTVDRNGSGSNGIGVGEFEVYDKDMGASWGKILSVVITGEAVATKNQTLTYTGQRRPAGPEGAVYAWSVAEGSEDMIQIVGAADQETVQIKTVAIGKATLNLSVTIDGIEKTTSKEIQIDGITDIDVYETNTAAGLAPILPKKVVANGITFDDPSPSAIGNNGVDFGETFDSKLIDVVWEEVDPALYAADKVGTTFEVNGTVTYGHETLDAVAKISVKEKMVAPVANSTVTFENVQLTDNFWLPKQEVNAVNSLNKAILEIEKASGGEPNFTNAIKKLNGESYSGYQGMVFQDSDIYKSIEAISYTLSVINDSTDPAMIAQKEKLEAKLAYWISLIEQVQYADGYIGTYFTLRSGQNATHRWKDFTSHEMYNAGHFYEAAVAYTRYRERIGDPDYSLYVVAKRSADQIVNLFGPGGSRNEVPGHEEIELAMVKLAKLIEEYEGVGTGQKYLDTVQLLINRRGETGRDSGYQGGEYSQDNGSIKEVTEAVGHAVRACYFYAGVTDMATLLPEGDPDRAAYLKTMDTIWDSVALTKTYITGGIGVAAYNESFGDPYELPNNSSYCETCAAIALANWNQRMNLVHEDAKYADVVERTLYNAILVGTNLEGNLFYYSSLLEVSAGNGRSQWFGCACCPPNLMRTISKLSEYMYTVHADDLFINMYIGSTGNVDIGGTTIGLVQTTEYPWDGAVKLEVNPEADKEFTMNIRIPGWVSDQYNNNVKITVNGEKVKAEAEKGYVAVTRTWKAGDVVMIDIPMEIRMTEADPNVTTNKDRIALERGPIVYCMEKAGNAQINNDTNFNPLNFVIPRDAELTATYNEELLNGVVEITGTVLYNNDGSFEEAQLQAVPYYAWNNRGDNGIQGQNSSSKMLIWTNAVGEKMPVLPLIADYDMTVEDGKLVDQTGNGFDAVLKNFAEGDITAEEDDAVLVFDGTDNYVELPAGMIETEQFAIEATFKSSTTNFAWLWCLGTKEGNPADNYVFVSPKYNENGIRAGIKHGEESLFGETAVVPNDTYTTIRVEFNKGILKLIVNGEEISSLETEFSIRDILAAGAANEISGYIGKSLWPNPYLTATMTDFKVYAVNFSELNAVLEAEYDKNLVETDWSTESWTAYTKALETAKTALESKDATQASVDACLENLLAAIDGLQERTRETEANIAPFATPSADYTNQYNTPVENINNKELATGDTATSWNCWGGATFPVGVYLTWNKEYVIESMRVLWWAYNDGGVQFPGSCQVQYKDAEGNWVTITGMTNELEEATDTVGVKYNGANNGVDGANTYWNEVKFAEPVKTTALKLVVERQAAHTGNIGIGISEWEVYQVYSDDPTPTPVPTDKSALEAAIEKVPEKVPEDNPYTEESWAALEKALTDANAVLAREDATQEEVDAAVEALENAVEALEYKKILPYTDVTEADWFYDAVAYTYYEGLMIGMDRTTFAPYGTLSRAQFALILYRIEGEPEVNTEKSFDDIVGDEWYGAAVLWAAEAGIVYGYDNGCFGPADNITREQMTVMMYRYANYLEMDTTNEGSLEGFNDAASVSEFAIESMKWAVAKQIIKGKEEGTVIDPQGNTTRAEAAAIIQRFMEK